MNPLDYAGTAVVDAPERSAETAGRILIAQGGVAALVAGRAEILVKGFVPEKDAVIAGYQGHITGQQIHDAGQAVAVRGRRAGKGLGQSGGFFPFLVNVRAWRIGHGDQALFWVRLLCDDRKCTRMGAWRMPKSARRERSRYRA